jgi:glycosyltransferase involved in cell wall biosynthesis
MKINPTVTIGLTTYNRPEFLRQAVKSIMDQTFMDFKLLIGNDDPNYKIIFDDLGIPYDSRVEILNNSSNIGEVANMNNLLEASNTEWFTWMADDDVFHSLFLESLVNAIKNNSQPVVASYTCFIAGGSLDSTFFDSVKPIKSIYMQPKDFVLQYVSRKINLIGCYGLMSTKILKKIGGMPLLGKSFSPYGDTLIPILLAEFGAINFIDMPLSFLRIHEESISSSSSSFNAYQTAESDFLSMLEMACTNIGDKALINKIKYNMVSWFRDNEFLVISRNQSISRIAVVRSFLLYQLKVNYSRIEVKYWCKFTYITLMIIFKVVTKSIYKIVFTKK